MVLGPDAAESRHIESKGLTSRNTVLLARSNYHVHGLGRSGAVK